jgi:hypothetical protein
LVKFRDGPASATGPAARAIDPVTLLIHLGTVPGRCKPASPRRAIAVPFSGPIHAKRRVSFRSSAGRPG